MSDAVYVCPSAAKGAPGPGRAPPLSGQNSLKTTEAAYCESCVLRRECRCWDQGLCLLLFDWILAGCDPGSERRPGPA